MSDIIGGRVNLFFDPIPWVNLMNKLPPSTFYDWGGGTYLHNALNFEKEFAMHCIVMHWRVPVGRERIDKTRLP